MKEHFFRSKVDRWIVVLLAISELVMFIPLAWVFVTGTTVDRIISALLALSIPITLAIILPVRYAIREEELLVRSGVLRWRIPIDAIESTRPTRDLLSSPALSLDRVRVTYRQNGKRAFILISPEPREEFLRVLASQDPGLTFDGDRIRRVQRVGNASNGRVLR